MLVQAVAMWSSLLSDVLVFNVFQWFQRTCIYSQINLWNLFREITVEFLQGNLLTTAFGGIMDQAGWAVGRP